MPRTLVTGATGFIGAHVTRLLVQRGEDVHVTVRERSRLQALNGLEVKPVRADILDRRAMRRALRGVERVYHMAGTTDVSASRARISSINVEGMRIVLEESLRAGVERVVHTSSVAAIGPAPLGQSADESQPWEAGRYQIPYIDAEHQAEVAALRLLARGLPLVIVNPAHTFGAGIGSPGPHSSTAIVGRFMRRQIPAYVEGTLNVVGVRDVARGLILAGERGAIGERYILGNRNFTLTRLFADLGRLSGIEPPAVKLPLGVALALSAASRRIGGLALPSPDEIRMASLNWAFVSAKARRELGWRPSAHEDCLEETVEFYRQWDTVGVNAHGSRQPLALRVAGGALRTTAGALRRAGL